MTKRAAIYARVSTTDQSDSGFSLPGQINECRAYAEKLGFDVTAEFSEDASGKKPFNERAQGMILTEMIQRRQIDAVIFHKVDRLGRDIVNILTTVQTWLKAGVEIYTGDTGKIESENDIILVVKAWQGGDEWKKIRERSMLGKRTKAQSGLVIGTRRPFGYQHVRNERGKVTAFEIVEEEAEIVSLIYQWYVYGDESGRKLPAMTIARKLSEMHIPTPGERAGGYHRTHGANVWQSCKIIHILSNEVYAGIWNYGIRIGSNTGLRRPKEEWIRIPSPAIIDRETWEAAQAQMTKNKLYAKRHARRTYLLSGLIRCVCGSVMAGGFYSNHKYYFCNWPQNHIASVEKQTCFAKKVRADAIELDVWDSIVGIFSDIERLEYLLRIAQKAELEAIDPKRRELQAIEGMIKKAEDDAAEIGQALKKSKGIVAGSLERDMQAVNDRYDALIERRDLLRGSINNIQLTDSAIQAVIDYAKDIKRGIENATDEMKRRNLEMFQVKVKIDNGHFYITSLIGSWDGEIRKLPFNQGKETNHNGEESSIVNTSCSI